MSSLFLSYRIIIICREFGFPWVRAQYLCHSRAAAGRLSIQIVYLWSPALSILCEAVRVPMGIGTIQEHWNSHEGVLIDWDGEAECPWLRLSDGRSAVRKVLVDSCEFVNRQGVRSLFCVLIHPFVITAERLWVRILVNTYSDKMYVFWMHQKSLWMKAVVEHKMFVFVIFSKNVKDQTLAWISWSYAH